MKPYLRWWQAVMAALLLVLTITAWALFAPAQLGGQAVYVIVNGNSMEPDFHLGDLVIARRMPDYQVGDIVVYRSAELKAFVFHRIIGLNLDRFILKGDNNSWTDSYQPTQAELIGKLWIHLPKVGKVITWARVPINMALITGALGGVLMAGAFTEKPGRKSKKKRPAKERQGYQVGFVEGTFFGLGFLFLASLALGIYSFTRPLLRAADPIKYEHKGTFSYSAAATPGVYDTGTVQTGDPVFPALTCPFQLEFTYALSGGQFQDLRGTHQLTAEIVEEQSNWQRTIPLEPETNFSGNSYATGATLNLCQVEALVEQMEQTTELHPASYTLAIVPSVTIAGTSGGQAFQDTFESRLLFRFDKLHFYLVNNDPATDPLNPSKAGLFQDTRREANKLSLLGLEPRVSTARVLALIVLGISLCGALALLLFVQSVARHSQESLVQMKYGPMLVNVSDGNAEVSPRTIEVATIDNLAKLAERNNSVILHRPQGPIHYYSVNAEGITYRCVLSEEQSGLLSVSDSSLGEELRQGFERGELCVYYQPIVSLTDGKIAAVEALMRWQHPERGLLSAGEFLPVAEETGLIKSMDQWMLQAACKQLKGWQEADLPLELAVNLSERQLGKDSIKFIARVLREAGIDPHALHIEIPEARLIEQAQAIFPHLQELNKLGVNISIDHFSGQSSLSSLGQLPVNLLKIDRPFIEKIGDPQEAIAIKKLISMAFSLGLKVVGGGVETEEQERFLHAQSCTLAQGYWLGRPVPPQEITRLLGQGNTPKQSGAAGQKPTHRKDSR